jgi:UDP-N-acetylmuramoyl-tripeptide--D-alanyl-D-alanine ligase
MFELGEYAPKMHAEVGEYAVEKNVDVLICIGELSESMYTAASKKRSENVYYFKTIEDFEKEKDNVLFDGLTVLVKASRGMHFEKVVEMLK